MNGNFSIMIYTPGLVLEETLCTLMLQTAQMLYLSEIQQIKLSL